MANLLQIRRMLRNRLGVSANDSFFANDKLDDAINNAIVTLEAERNWPWQQRHTTLTTTDATGNIALPTDWRSTRALWIDEHELDFVPAYDVLRIPANTGNPSIYSHTNRTLVVRPVPSVGTVFTILYDRECELLTSDNDVPDLPENAYPAIVAKAAHLCSTREDDRPSAQSHLIEYGQWVERLFAMSVQTRRPVGRRIRPGNWV